MIEDKDLTKIL